MLPLVSVVIPCYMQANFLPSCISSLQAQTYANWEAIIVNDGSPDETREVAIRLQSKEPRLRYLEKTNGGVSSARNFALSVVEGEFIQFLDADDLLPPEKFSDAVSLMLRSVEVAATYGDYFYLDEHVKKVVNRFSSPRFHTNDFLLELILRWELDFSIPIHSFLFRSSVWKEAGLHFDEHLASHEDWDVWLRFLKTQPLLARIDGCTAIYRINPGSVSRNHHRMGQGFLKAIKKHIKDPDNSSKIRSALKVKYSLTNQGYGWGLRAAFAKLLNLPSVQRHVTWRLPVRMKIGLGLAVEDRLAKILAAHSDR